MKETIAWLGANPLVWIPYAYIGLNFITSLTKTQKDDLVLVALKKALHKAGLL